jgi:hypothetical protein
VQLLYAGGFAKGVVESVAKIGSRVETESFRGSQGLALYQGTTSVVPHGPKTVLGFSPCGLFLAK